MIKEVKKVWGKEHWIVNTPKYCGKKLILKKGYQCSLHYHKIKDETFYIIKGKIELEVYPDKKCVCCGFTLTMGPGDYQRLKPGTVHRFRSITKIAEIIEFSTHHIEKDSYRLEKSCQIKSKRKRQ